MSLRDLDVTLELRWGFEHAKALQALDDLTTVAIQALGGKTSRAPPTPPPVPAAHAYPQSEAELRASFASAIGIL